MGGSHDAGLLAAFVYYELGTSDATAVIFDCALSGIGDYIDVKIT